MTSPPPPPLRIAVLEADIPLDRILEKYGTYGDIFTRLLHQAADTIDLPRERLEISKWDVLRKMEYPDLEGGEVDAVLITGSREFFTFLFAFFLFFFFFTPFPFTPKRNHTRARTHHNPVHHTCKKKTDNISRLTMSPAFPPPALV